MTNETTLRRRPDGSLDTAHYMAQGRTRRSEAAHDFARTTASAPPRSVFGLAALAALFPFLGGNS